MCALPYGKNQNGLCPSTSILTTHSAKCHGGENVMLKCQVHGFFGHYVARDEICPLCCLPSFKTERNEQTKKLFDCEQVLQKRS